MRSVFVWLTALPVALGALLSTTPALAVGTEEASGNYKGTIGGGLLGAELVLAIEAAIDVESPWLYVAGGVGGAAGGAIGGYFIEQSASARVSMLMLAGGLTLAIPTTVAVLSATAYEPPENYIQDQAPADEPVADPPQPGAAPAPTSKAPVKKPLRLAKKRPLPPLRLTPPALIDVTPNMLALSVPAVEIRDAYTRVEIAMYGAEQTAEVHVPVLNVSF
jgi:hypothetical protein